MPRPMWPKPGFIRVEADEATYNLHIIIRFGLERKMLKGELAVRDLPKLGTPVPKLLGVEVTMTPTDACRTSIGP